MATYPYETIIAYEDRTKVFTHDWRLAALKTVSSGSTDNGLLYFSLTLSSTTYTAEVYKDSGKASGNKIASGTVVSATAPTEADPLDITLAEANSSGVTGALKIASYTADEDGGYLQVLLSVDADCDDYYDGYDLLNAYDSTYGLARHHNLAMFEIINYLSTRFSHEFSGAGKSPWWQAGDKKYPDLRRILNPAQLRKASAYYTLFSALSKSAFNKDSSYWELRDWYEEKYKEALTSVQLALDIDVDQDGDKLTAIGVSKIERA